MKKKTNILNRFLGYCLLLLIGLNYSCNHITDKSNANNNSEIKIEKQEKSKNNDSIKTAKLYYKASGSEPGWSIEINKESEGLSYKLELDYGEIKKEGKASLKRLDKSNYLKLEVLNDLNDIEIKIKLEKCNDNAGNPHESSIIIRYNGKTYLGCGDFLMDTLLKDELKSASTIDHYICFKDNLSESRKIWIGFNKQNIALKLKYEGQTQEITLEYDREEYVKGGTHPTLIKYYHEIYGGKINGSYKTIHSGNWDYVEYKRGKDGKYFKFTIDHKLNPYGKSPCF